MTMSGISAFGNTANPFQQTTQTPTTPRQQPLRFGIIQGEGSEERRIRRQAAFDRQRDSMADWGIFRTTSGIMSLGLLTALAAGGVVLLERWFDLLP